MRTKKCQQRLIAVSLQYADNNCNNVVGVSEADRGQKFKSIAVAGINDVTGRSNERPADELLPLSTPLQLPEIPFTGFCEWSFDEETRVLLADFRVSSSAVEEGVNVGAKLYMKIMFSFSQ